MISGSCSGEFLRSTYVNEKKEIDDVMYQPNYINLKINNERSESDQLQILFAPKLNNVLCVVGSFSPHYAQRFEIQHRSFVFVDANRYGESRMLERFCKSNLFLTE